jgi:DNA-binding transcriptional LysR family regulator
MLSKTYEVFFEVASYKSFSKAAEALYISQPAVSKQIKNLESNLGIQLIERKGNTIKLTSSDDRLFDYLHKAKSIQNHIESDIAIIKDQRTSKGTLKIGASTTISLYVMPKILSAFHRKFPDVKLLMINRNSENILKALIDREIDIAIIEAHYKINAVHFLPFMDDEIIPVCATSSPYCKKEILIDDLKNVPIAFRERGSGTHLVVQKCLEAQNIRMGDLNVIARLGGTEALKNFLIEDKCIGFLSRLAVVKELQSGLLREVKIKSFQMDRRFEFVMRNGEEEAGLTKFFVKEARFIYNL